ncbi:CHAT domain-containing protein [Streptomyces mirabilis]
MVKVQADGGDLQPQLYAELRARVTRAEETGDIARLDDPKTVELASVLFSLGGMMACDMLHTLAAVFWRRHQVLGRTPLADRGRRDAEQYRYLALVLYAWIDALLPSLVPLEARSAVAALGPLPNGLTRVAPEERLSALHHSALAAFRRYDVLRDGPTLRLGLALMREVVEATSRSGPDADTLGVSARTSLGAGLQRQLDLTDDPAVLAEALSVSGEAVARCPGDDPERALVLFNYGTLLLESHKRTPDDSALRESVRVSFQALRLTSPDDPERASRLSHVQQLHSLQYERTGDVDSLRRAVELGATAVRVVPPDHHRRAAMLHNLGKDLHTLYTATGDLTDLLRAAQAQRAAVADSRSNDPKTPSRRHNLGITLAELADATKEADAIREAVAVGEENLRLVPPGHPQHAGALEVLMKALLTACREGQSARTADLVRVARLHLAAAARGAPTAKATARLAGALLMRYKATGDLDPLVESVSLYRGLAERALREAALADPIPAGPAGTGTSQRAVEDHPVAVLLLLVDALYGLYQHRGDLDALQEAEASARRALELSPAPGMERALALSKLGTVLDAAADRFSDEDAYVTMASEALLRCLEAERACPEDDERYPAVLLQAGAALHRLVWGEPDPTAIALGMSLLRRAVDLLPVDAENGPAARSILAGMLLARHRYRGTSHLLDDIPDDLPLASSLARAAADAVADDDPERGQYLSQHADVLSAIAEADGDPRAAAEAVQVNRTVAALPSAYPATRFEAAAKLAGAHMDRGDAQGALDAVETAVSLLPVLAPRDLAPRDRQHQVGRTSGLAGLAAAAAVAAGLPARAVELLEQTRGLLHADALPDPDGELQGLRRSHPALARAYDQLRAAGTATASLVRLPGARHATETRYQAGRDWGDLLSRIRVLPGHGDFLRPPAVGGLLRKAAEGPVVLVYASPWRCDALVLRPDADPGRPVDVVPLPQLDVDDAVERTERLTRMAAAAGTGGFDAREQAQRDIHGALEWLWDAIAAPVLDHLGIDGTPSREVPRVWWCPVAFLSRLPVHAAGRHREPGEAGRLRPTVMDRTVSSTTATLRTLEHSRARAEAHAPARQTPDRPPVSALVVTMAQTPGAKPLAQAAAEEQVVTSLLGRAGTVATLAGEQATSAAVSAQLRRHGLAHFICHGVSDPVDPSRNRLLLADHQHQPLTVAALAGMRLDRAELAYLSACTTAAATRFTDEALHITAAFQVAGYPHVVGTLWPVSDLAARTVAEGFYRRLVPETHPRPDLRNAAQALNATLLDLRDRFPLAPTWWAAHLHVGA